MSSTMLSKGSGTGALVASRAGRFSSGVLHVAPFEDGKTFVAKANCRPANDVDKTNPFIGYFKPKNNSIWDVKATTGLFSHDWSYSASFYSKYESSYSSSSGISTLESPSLDNITIHEARTSMDSRYHRDFEEVRQLGSGGQGQVFKAKSRIDGQCYAVKRIQLPKSDEIHLREAKAMAQMPAHENIVRYHTAWIEEDHVKNKVLYIQMEICDPIQKGEVVEDLSTWIRNSTLKSNRLKDGLNLFDQIVRGAKHMHASGIIHRDLKPENIFIKENTAKIGDFGLAKCAFRPEFESCSSLWTEMAKKEHTTQLGTYLYASPEQLGLGRNKSCYSDLSDIYALGIVLLEICCPFPTMMERAQVLNEVRYVWCGSALDEETNCNDYNRHGILPQQALNLDPKLMSLIKTMTAADPTQRPSADQVLQQLRMCQRPVGKLQVLHEKLTRAVSQLRERSQATLELDILLSEFALTIARLKPMERASVCTIQDPQWIQQLLLAFHQQGTQVRSFMMVVNDNKRQQDANCFLKRPMIRSADGEMYNKSCLDDAETLACRQLIKYIRIFNTSKSCDTVSVSISICQDPESFFQLMDRIARHEFLRQMPATVEFKKGSWGRMPWAYDQMFLTLAAIVVNALEIQIWTHWQKRNHETEKRGLWAKLHLISTVKTLDCIERNNMFAEVAQKSLQYIARDCTFATVAESKAALLTIKSVLDREGAQQELHESEIVHQELWFSCSLNENPHYCRYKLYFAEELQARCSFYLGDAITRPIEKAKNNRVSLKKSKKKQRKKNARLRRRDERDRQKERCQRTLMLTQLCEAVSERESRIKSSVAQMVEDLVEDCVQLTLQAPLEDIVVDDSSVELEERVLVSTPNYSPWLNSPPDLFDQSKSTGESSRSFAREPDTSPQKWSLPPTFSKSNPAWSFSTWNEENMTYFFTACPGSPSSDSEPRTNDTSINLVNQLFDDDYAVSSEMLRNESDLDQIHESISDNECTRVEVEAHRARPKRPIPDPRKTRSASSGSLSAVRRFRSPQSTTSSPGLVSRSVPKPKRLRKRLSQSHIACPLKETIRPQNSITMPEDTRISMLEKKCIALEQDVARLGQAFTDLQRAVTQENNAQTPHTNTGYASTPGYPCTDANIQPNLFVSIPASMVPQRSKLHWDICEFVARTQEEARLRLPCFLLAQRSCTNAVNALWPRAQVRPYGSIVTGLSLPSSDLDMVICLPNVRRDAPAETPGALEGRNAIKETWQQNLARKLRAEEWVVPESVKTIANAPIPIITFLTVPLPSSTSTNHQIRLDISFEGSSHNGLATNSMVLSLIHEFPALRPLVLILKTFLIRRGFCAAYTGGLSSYALLLLVARFLQEISRPTATAAALTASCTADLGALLINFLDFYGNRFDPRVSGISTVNRCFFNRDELHAMTRDPTTLNDDGLSQDSQNAFEFPNLASPGSKRRRHRSPTQDWEINRFVEPSSAQDNHKFDPIYIEDPLGTGNNIGRNCFRITQIRRSFSAAVDRLSTTTAGGYDMTSSVNGVVLHPNNALRHILL